MVPASTPWRPSVFVGPDPYSLKVNGVLLSLGRSSGIGSVGATGQVTALLLVCCHPPASQHSSTAVQQTQGLELGKSGVQLPVMLLPC